MFLILRCKPSETKAVALKLKHDRHILGIDEQDVQCPTELRKRRIGRARHRDRTVVNILPSYVFVRWNGRPQWALALQGAYAGLVVMRDVHGGFATCKEEEIHRVAVEGFTKAI